MTLKEQLKSDLMTAMKMGDELKREILRVVVGEVNNAESGKSLKTFSEDEIHNLIRKIVTNNELAISVLKGEAEFVDNKIVPRVVEVAKVLSETEVAQKEKLENEIAILISYLPKVLSVEEIKKHLEPVLQQIKESQGGLSMKIAMDHLKSLELKVLGKDVKEAVTAIKNN